MTSLLGGPQCQGSEDREDRSGWLCVCPLEQLQQPCKPPADLPSALCGRRHKPPRAGAGSYLTACLRPGTRKTLGDPRTSKHLLLHSEKTYNLGKWTGKNSRVFVTFGMVTLGVMSSRAERGAWLSHHVHAGSHSWAPGAGDTRLGAEGAAGSPRASPPPPESPCRLRITYMHIMKGREH